MALTAGAQAGKITTTTAATSDPAQDPVSAAVPTTAAAAARDTRTPASRIISSERALRVEGFISVLW